MDYKIYNIELVNRLLAWQHTAFKTKTSIPIALPDREQVPAAEAGEPLPDQQEPVDPLNVITWDAADFVLCHKVHCSIGFQENHRLCRWDKKVILMVLNSVPIPDTPTAFRFAASVGEPR